MLGLVRAATAENDPLPEELDRQISGLSVALERLADTPQPWPTEVLEQVNAISAEAMAYSAKLGGRARRDHHGDGTAPMRTS